MHCTCLDWLPYEIIHTLMNRLAMEEIHYNSALVNSLAMIVLLVQGSIRYH